MKRAHIFVKAGIFFIVCLGLLLLIGNTGQTAAKGKHEDIRKLLNLTGAGTIGVQVMENMIASFKTNMPQIKTEFWDEFMKEVNPHELVNLIVPVYAKHLSNKDIKGLIKFFESPVGKKFVKVQPQIVEESMAIGQKWGQDLGNKAMMKLRAQSQAQPAPKKK